MSQREAILVESGDISGEEFIDFALTTDYTLGDDLNNYVIPLNNHNELLTTFTDLENNGIVPFRRPVRLNDFLYFTNDTDRNNPIGIVVRVDNNEESLTVAFFDRAVATVD